MKHTPTFIEAQRRLSRYLRDPLHEAPPAGLSGERLEVYRYAVRHNIDRFMADNFPRVRAALAAEQWDALIDCYLRHHPAQTAAFPRLPGEFLSFLTSHQAPPSLPPQVYDLAHFEWLENAVACDEQTVPVHGFDPEGDLLEHPVLINPVHRLASYRYPVHSAPPEALSDEEPAQEIHLVVFRDSAHQLHVLDLNAVTRTLFEHVRDGPEMSVRQVLTDMAQAMGHPSPGAVLRGGLDILQRMRRRGLVLGTRTA
jgi:hypothetical protein